MPRRILAPSARGSEEKKILKRKRMFQVELQYDDIKGPTEIDMTRIPEFPASAALQSIEPRGISLMSWPTTRHRKPPMPATRPHSTPTTLRPTMILPNTRRWMQ